MSVDTETFETLKAPFPWFGGKSRAAELIWSRLGNVDNYVEPFAGSLAVLLARPTPPRSETVNDLDCYLANFWRSTTLDPAAVAVHADWPVNEADLHARHLWLVNQAEFRERMKTDPEFFDVRVAGWWVWGLSCWIGGGWCALRERPWQQRPQLTAGKRIGVNAIERKRPQATAGRAGNGVHAKLPHVESGRTGKGVCQKMPALHPKGEQGVGSYVRDQMPRLDAMCDTKANNVDASELIDWFEQLRARLRRTRVVCGDWKRVLGPTPLGMTSNVPPGFRTGVMLDPPYDREIRDKGLYASDGTATLSREVRDWAVEHGEDERLRIVLCGYEGEHEMPASWECVPWKAAGGYGNRTGNQNAKRERVWFSPHCLKPEPELF